MSRVPTPTGQSINKLLQYCSVGFDTGVVDGIISTLETSELIRVRNVKNRKFLFNNTFVENGYSVYFVLR